MNSYPSCNLKISGSSEEFFSALGRIRAAEEASYSRDHQIYEDRRRNKRSGYSFDFHHESRDIFVIHLWTFQGKRRIFFAMPKGKSAEAQKSEVLQGTLDLMVLKVLDALGPQHGYGIARRIEQVSEQVLQLNEGTVYTSLLRLQQRKWISAEWGASENNRKAKYYSITKSGRKQLARETENWERIAGIIGRLLKLEGQG